MYRVLSKTDTVDYEALSFNLLSDPERLKQAMLKVIQSWPIASEFNLTDTKGNRKSWLGQAACCIECCSPEIITRHAWMKLSESQREAANKVAQEVIDIFENQYAEKEA